MHDRETQWRVRQRERVATEPEVGRRQLYSFPRLSSPAPAGRGNSAGYCAAAALRTAASRTTCHNHTSPQPLRPHASRPTNPAPAGLHQMKKHVETHTTVLFACEDSECQHSSTNAAAAATRKVARTSRAASGVVQVRPTRRKHRSYLTVGTTQVYTVKVRSDERGASPAGCGLERPPPRGCQACESTHTWGQGRQVRGEGATVQKRPPMIGMLWAVRPHTDTRTQGDARH